MSRRFEMIVDKNDEVVITDAESGYGALFMLVVDLKNMPRKLEYVEGVLRALNGACIATSETSGWDAAGNRRHPGHELPQDTVAAWAAQHAPARTSQISA